MNIERGFAGVVMDGWNGWAGNGIVGKRGGEGGAR